LALVVVAALAVPAQAFASVCYRSYYGGYVCYNPTTRTWYRTWTPPAPSPAPTPTPAPSPAPAPTPGLNADEQHILNAVNAERAKAGLGPLRIDMRLVATARQKSQDMITNRYFAHQSPVLGSPFDQMRRAGITYRIAGENIAGNSSAAGAMQAWMQSPGHRANILNPNFTHIGIGTVAGGPYGKMHTQHFIGI
jgi:uncharacterized YkwD family protein